MASITQLEYLLAVDQLRHFGKAAKACHVSQPTLSMQLQKLEDEFGITFFDRQKKPVVPTQEALPLIEQARTVIREVRKLDHLGKNRDHVPSGRFTLAVIPTLSPYLLPLFIGSFASRYPKVELLLEEMTTESIIEALREDRIDAGILATPLGIESLQEQPLFYEPFHALVSEKHPLSRHARISESVLDGPGAQDVWLLTEGHCLRGQVMRLCSLQGKAGVFSNLRFESGNLETVIQLVSEGYGYTLLPELAARSIRDPRTRKLLRPFSNPVPTREVSLVTRRSQFKQAIVNALKAEIEARLPPELPRKREKKIEVVGL